MPASRADLFQWLDDLGVAYRTVEHKAIFTVEEGQDLKRDLPGGHSKNLFLKDKEILRQIELLGFGLQSQQELHQQLQLFL